MENGLILGEGHNRGRMQTLKDKQAKGIENRGTGHKNIETQVQEVKYDIKTKL